MNKINLFGLEIDKESLNQMHLDEASEIEVSYLSKSRLYLKTKHMAYLLILNPDDLVYRLVYVYCRRFKREEMLDFIQFCKQNDCADCALNHLKNMLAPDKELTCSILFDIMRVSITEYKGVALKVSQGCGLLESIRKNSSNRPPLEITITLQEHLLVEFQTYLQERLYAGITDDVRNSPYELSYWFKKRARDAFKHIMETNAKVDKLVLEDFEMQIDKDDLMDEFNENLESAIDNNSITVKMLKDSSIKPIYDRETILKNAEKCVLQDRNNQYGEPEDIFEDVALLWDSYTKITTQLRDDYKENEIDVCMKQILLKIVRAIHNPAHMDNYVDIAGYAACAGELASKKSIKE